MNNNTKSVRRIEVAKPSKILAKHSQSLTGVRFKGLDWGVLPTSNSVTEATKVMCYSTDFPSKRTLIAKGGNSEQLSRVGNYDFTGDRSSTYANVGSIFYDSTIKPIYCPLKAKAEPVALHKSIKEGHGYSSFINYVASKALDAYGSIQPEDFRIDSKLIRMPEKRGIWQLSRALQFAQPARVDVWKPNESFLLRGVAQQSLPGDCGHISLSENSVGRKAFGILHSYIDQKPTEGPEFDKGSEEEAALELASAIHVAYSYIFSHSLGKRQNESVIDVGYNEDMFTESVRDYANFLELRHHRDNFNVLNRSDKLTEFLFSKLNYKSGVQFNQTTVNRDDTKRVKALASRGVVIVRPLLLSSLDSFATEMNKSNKIFVGVSNVHLEICEQDIHSQWYAAHKYVLTSRDLNAVLKPYYAQWQQRGRLELFTPIQHKNYVLHSEREMNEFIVLKRVITELKMVLKQYSSGVVERPVKAVDLLFKDLADLSKGLVTELASQTGDYIAGGAMLRIVKPITPANPHSKANTHTIYGIVHPWLMYINAFINGIRVSLYHGSSREAKQWAASINVSPEAQRVMSLLVNREHQRAAMRAKNVVEYFRHLTSTFSVLNTRSDRYDFILEVIDELETELLDGLAYNSRKYVLVSSQDFANTTISKVKGAINAVVITTEKVVTRRDALHALLSQIVVQRAKKIKLREGYINDQYESELMIMRSLLPYLGVVATTYEGNLRLKPMHGTPDKFPQSELSYFSGLKETTDL